MCDGIGFIGMGRFLGNTNDSKPFCMPSAIISPFSHRMSSIPLVSIKLTLMASSVSLQRRVVFFGIGLKINPAKESIFVAQGSSWIRVFPISYSKTTRSKIGEIPNNYHLRASQPCSEWTKDFLQYLPPWDTPNEMAQTEPNHPKLPDKTMKEVEACGECMIVPQFDANTLENIQSFGFDHMGKMFTGISIVPSPSLWLFWLYFPQCPCNPPSSPGWAGMTWGILSGFAI